MFINYRKRFKIKDKILAYQMNFDIQKSHICLRCTVHGKDDTVIINI